MMIFVSSTVDDMQDERNAIEDVLNTIKLSVSRCESFVARKGSPREICLKEASSCDIFVGIYKNLYGFVPKEQNPEGYSVTEMEYNEAIRHKRKPILFISSDAIIRKEELKIFVNKIKNFTFGSWCYFYDDISDLKNWSYRML